jgi:hypothetical protein
LSPIQRRCFGGNTLVCGYTLAKQRLALVRQSLYLWAGLPAANPNGRFYPKMGQFCGSKVVLESSFWKDEFLKAKTRQNPIKNRVKKSAFTLH